MANKCITTASISPDISMLTQDSWLWRPVLYSMSQSTCDILDFNTEIYSEFIKDLYCPKMYDPSKLTFEEVRQMSIQVPNSKNKEVKSNETLAKSNFLLN
jgi:hypothetical protein